jgi:hypothetical protein
MSEVKTDKLSPRTASGTVTLGTSGDTFSIPSGVTLTNSGTASGFGSPAYASNASATDDTVNVDASDNLQFNSGYGSTATAYGCRAWVNFNGTGTVAIRESGNVSSITDNGTGQYAVNFDTAMPDEDYAFFGSAKFANATNWGRVATPTGTYLTTSCELRCTYVHSGGTNEDQLHVAVAIFR